MQTIHKFPIQLRDKDQSVAMPFDAHHLSVAYQGDRLCIWAIVDTEAGGTELRTVRVVGTGQPTGDLAGFDFVGTVQDKVAGFVWHVFLAWPKPEGR